MMNIKLVLMLIPILIVAGCVEQPAETGGQQGSAIQPPAAVTTPEAAARDYASKTYFNTETTTYSDFSFSTRTIDATTAEVTIRFKQVVKAPNYTLTRVMEQTVGTEKRGDAWVVTNTPNARIVSQSYN